MWSSPGDRHTQTHKPINGQRTTAKQMPLIPLDCSAKLRWSFTLDDTIWWYVNNVWRSRSWGLFSDSGVRHTVISCYGRNCLIIVFILIQMKTSNKISESAVRLIACFYIFHGSTAPSWIDKYTKSLPFLCFQFVFALKRLIHCFYLLCVSAVNSEKSPIRGQRQTFKP